MGRFLKYWLLGALFTLALLCSGCAAGTLDGTLYRLPKLPAEYESLEKQLDELLSSGAEYAAPTSGSNLQSVQMVDLDGDGEDEAVAMFRRANDEHPMKIYVFRADGSNYEQYCVIEGTSNAIYSINYVDLNGDGWREILAGIRSDLDVQNLSVYSLASGTPQQLLLTGYSRYAARDMDGDGQQDLVVLRSDEESYAVADYYNWNGAEMELRSSLHLSGSVAELNRLTYGTLSGGESALFVTSVSPDGVANVDILTVDDAVLHSILNGAQAYRFLDLYPGDVNGDGVTEVPEAVPFPLSEPEGPVYYRICWRQYAATGESAVTRETYQDTQSGWSLLLPEEWGDQVCVSRSSNAEGSTVSFFRHDSRRPFLNIYAFTGENRSSLALRRGRIVLSRQAEISYAAELFDEGDGMIDEQGLRERFGLVAAEWTTGEN